MPRARKEISRAEYVEDLGFQVREIADAASEYHRLVYALWEWQTDHKLAGENAPELLTDAINTLHHRVAEATQAAGGLVRLMDWLDPPDRVAKRIKRR
jgi:hypothetical protein